jgi:phosphatidylserine decarboxylase
MQRLLAGNDDLLQHLAGGTMVLSRLCPVDYHHFHYPLKGEAGTVEWVDGRLYSVSPIALRQRLGYFWENKRTITQVKHPAGTYVFMEIGATNVGSIHHVASRHGGPVATGARKGWFAFGGSSVLSWFPAGMVQLDADLLSCSARGVELYARVNDRMGCLSAG